MSTKMKGLFKGLRYISQIFDEEQQQKEQDMQIGLPTDVKHVAHIGWDGDGAASTAADSPGWMKDFSPSTPGMSAPGDSKPSKDNAPEIKWVSEDSKRGQRTKKSQEKEHGSEGPKPSRRRSTDNNSTDTSPKKPTRRQSADNATAKPRQSRRSQTKDSSDGGGKESSASDVPKKSRRKKSESNEGGSRRSKNRAATANCGDAAAESDDGPHVQKRSSLLSSVEDDEEREGRVNSKE